MMQTFLSLTVTGLHTTPDLFCELMLSHCMSDETGRVAVQRMDDSVTWEDAGGFMERMTPPVYFAPNDAFHLAAMPVAVGNDLARVDFTFTPEAEGFLQQVVLREIRLTWPEMQVTESETAEQPAATEMKAKRAKKLGPKLLENRDDWAEKLRELEKWEESIKRPGADKEAQAQLIGQVSARTMDRRRKRRGVSK